MEEIYIGIIGHGTVGSGTAQILINDAERLSKLAGKKLTLKSIYDKKPFPKSRYSSLFVKSQDNILEDREIKIVCEAAGGVSPAFEWCLKAINNGKHVITSNKELVCEKGTELLEAARKNGVQFLFEASVGGGMPCLHMIAENMDSADIISVSGILNGTTNYILDKMTSSGISYSQALLEAQKLGYAEMDPANDVKGTDSARKISIISSILWKKSIPLKNVSTIGIERITLQDIETAKALGLKIKLLAQAKIDKKGDITASVIPTLIDNKNMISSVLGCDNILIVQSKNNSPVTIIGAGSGKMPTASAMVSDICDIAKEKNSSVSWSLDEKGITSSTDFRQNFLFVVPSFDLEKIKVFLKGMNLQYRLQPSPPCGGYLLMVDNLGLTGYEFLRQGLKQFGNTILGYPIIM